jgi:hypothetical protein
MAELLKYVNENIKDKYTVKMIIDKRLVVNVKTKEAFNDMQDKIWDYNHKVCFIDNDVYSIHKSQTCIKVERINTSEYDLNIEFCDKQWYIDEGYQIIDIGKVI